MIEGSRSSESVPGGVLSVCVRGGAPTVPLPPHATLPHWQEQESHQIGGFWKAQIYWFQVLTAVLNAPSSPPGDKEPQNPG